MSLLIFLDLTPVGSAGSSIGQTLTRRFRLITCPGSPCRVVFIDITALKYKKFTYSSGLGHALDSAGPNNIPLHIYS